MKVVGREGEACAFSGEVKEITSLEAIEQLAHIPSGRAPDRGPYIKNVRTGRGGGG